MTAPDRGATDQIALASTGSFSNRISVVNCQLHPDSFCGRTGVTVLSAVGKVRRNIWFEARALQCPQRACVVFYAAQGPPSQSPAPSPRRAIIASEATPGWILVKVSSDGCRLLGPVEWLPRPPHAVQNRGEFSGKRHARLAGA